jgi:zinc transporter ZupT
LHAQHSHGHGSLDADDCEDDEEGDNIPAADAEAWRGRSRQRRLQTLNDSGDVTNLNSAMAGERESFMTNDTTSNTDAKESNNMNSKLDDTTSGSELSVNINSSQSKSLNPSVQISASRSIIDDAVEDPKGSSAFIGLIVHAAVDGVALGAAVAEGDASLGAIVFLAIMLHKAPSSFGLATYLLHHGSSISQV